MKKPRKPRSTQAQIRQLECQIYQVLRDDHPQSVRHVFYRMTDPRLPCPVEKSEEGYVQVQNRLVKMRRADRNDPDSYTEYPIHYGWIVDHTRRGYHTPTYDSAEDFIRNVASLYRGDLWMQADCYCEVWAESRSIAGVLQADCEELAVSLYPTGGFSSLTLAYEAAEVIKWKKKPVKILYIGDYDPAGVLIDVSLEKELRTHLPASNGHDIEFERIAITEAQIAEYGLPGKPRKEGDRRALHIQETVEAEAMPAAIMRALVRERVEALLPPQALEVTKKAEESERARLIDLAECGWND